MLTVGYGDIHATNTGERFFAILIMLIGSLMFGAIIAKVRVLVESRNIKYRELKMRVAEFKSYLEEKRIPLALKAEAKVFLYPHIEPPCAVVGHHIQVPVVPLSCWNIAPGILGSSSAIVSCAVSESSTTI